MRGVLLTMILISHELNRLVDDYYRCPNLIIKEQILNDILFLTEAFLIIDQA